MTYYLSNGQFIKVHQQRLEGLGDDPSIFFDQTYYNEDTRREGRFIVTATIKINEATTVEIMISSEDGITWEREEQAFIPAVMAPPAGAALAAYAVNPFWGPPPTPGGGGGGGSSTIEIPVMVAWPELADSSTTQNAAFCSFESTITQSCSLSVLPTSQSIVKIVSGKGLSIIAIGLGGDVLVTNTFGIKWDVIAKLNLPPHNIVELNSLFYDNYQGVFKVLGYDSNNNPVFLSSEDGYYWENITIPRFSNLAATTDSYCAIENDESAPSAKGQVWCWGSNNFNKLGLGDSKSFTPARALVPDKIGIASKETSPMAYTSLAGGDSHMCALRTSGNQIDCWGGGESGQLGDGTVYGPGYSTPTPTSVNLSGIDSVDKLVSGGSHSCILSDGNIWCWGSNQNNEIDGTSSQNIFPRPTQANFNLPFSYTDVATGADFTCGMSSNQVNCWGNNYSLPYQTMPLVESGGVNVSISAGGQTACMLTSQMNSGTNAWCWGDNTYGQLGNGKIGGSTYTPGPVIFNGGTLRFVSLSQSAVNTCGVTDKGFVYCWGDNTYQQTGVSESGPILNPQSPIQLNGFPGNFVIVSTGLFSICLVSNEVNVTGVTHNTYCLGNNSEGQLGVNWVSSMESKPYLVNTVFFNGSQ